VEVHVGQPADSHRQIDALVDDPAIDALPRRVQHAVQVDDVAELQPRQVGVGDRRRQPDLVHPDVVQPLDHFNGACEPGATAGGLTQALAGIACNGACEPAATEGGLTQALAGIACNGACEPAATEGGLTQALAGITLSPRGGSSR